MNRDYKWEYLLGELEFNSTQEMDEWVELVKRCIGVRGKSLGTGVFRDQSTHPFTEIRVIDAGEAWNAVAICARLRDSPHKMVIGVAGRNYDEIDSEEKISFWVEVFNDAYHSLRSDKQRFRWAAVIGPKPNTISATGIKLSAPAVIGGCEVASYERPLVEVVPPQVPSLYSMGFFRSVPISVVGYSEGRSWENSIPESSDDLQRVCALLSVAWDIPIIVRATPQPIVNGVIELPRYPPWSKNPYEELTEGETFDDSHEKLVTVPEWLEGAYHRLRRKEKWRRVGRALDAFSEGLRLEYSHPSLALVSFVAAIEAISLIVFKDGTCPECCQYCKNHSHIAKMYRATLGLVVDGEDLKLLSQSYGKRSKTVHTGRMHGIEGRSNPYYVSLFTENEAMTFQWQEVYKLRNAARELLLKSLKEELPSKSPLDFSVNL
ncbi:hypothetical protein LG943_10940 [Streptomonospora sp. S1-112]|uniref:Uncharacterized protein n=1 Tax=Streptomonospora mangrovi TaxID=2883123 RepID=A0A9X3NKU7_9ACTN|nr:hypothetical protein [Streptomonospora mangrovi]MDA0564835.1 hypothetical protein [Streptomonospora mangrovi]